MKLLELWISIGKESNLSFSICCHELVSVWRYSNRIQVLINFVKYVHTFVVFKESNLIGFDRPCKYIASSTELANIYS